jgi:thiol-disulfide isomerase/thioredoxin
MSKQVRPAVLIFAIAALAFSLGYVVLPHDEAGHDIYTGLDTLRPDPGATAAAFTVTRLDGTEMSSAELEGQIVVVDFWATWCGPCLTEIPAYNALSTEYAGKGVKLLGITMQSGSAEQVSEWISKPVKVGSEEFTLDYPVVMGNEALEYAWGPIYGFPMTFLVDAEWKIRKRWLGAVPNKSEQLRVLIDQLLEERAVASN